MSIADRVEQVRPPRIENLERPRYAAQITEDLLTGSRLLRQGFIKNPVRFAGRDAPLVRAGAPDPEVILVRSGFAYRSCVLADGRRSILDIVVPGDFIGLDHAVLAQPIEDVIAAGRLAYHALDGAELRQLMHDPAIALQIMALLAEARWRADRLAASIGRMDAQARLGVMLFDIYDRLRRRGLISGSTFNLPLTQEQIADHLGLTLVHVNRTLRKLREEKVVMVDRQVVIILDVDRLRAVAQGLPQSAEAPEPLLGPAPPVN